MENKLFFL